jgi:hypothetical protein
LQQHLVVTRSYFRTFATVRAIRRKNQVLIVNPMTRTIVDMFPET